MNPRTEMAIPAVADVVVPTVGRPSLRGLLTALSAQADGLTGRVLLVDDRKRPDGPLLTELPTGLDGRVAVLRGRGAGPAAARNLGWRSARSPWVVFLDDDVVPDPGWVVALAADLASADGTPQVGGSQGRLRVPVPRGRRPTDWERNVQGLERARWATADMAYRRAALAAVGGFDERFGRAYREDADLGLRVTRAGWQIVTGTRTVTHPVAPADAWVSVRLQRGNADDALMTALHGQGWRAAAGAPPGRRGRHLAVTAAAAAGLAGLGLSAAAPSPAGTVGRVLALSGAAGWVSGTAELAWARIAPGPRTAGEVTTMLATSAVLPAAASVHWLRGLAARRRLLRDRVRAPHPEPRPTSGPAPAEPARDAGAATATPPTVQASQAGPADHARADTAAPAGHGSATAPQLHQPPTTTSSHRHTSQPDGAPTAGRRPPAGQPPRPAPAATAPPGRRGGEGPRPYVLVARQDSLGDVLLAGPAVRAVAAGAGRVTLLCGPRGRAAAELLPGVDDVLEWAAPWIEAGRLPVSRAATERLVGELARRRIDQAVVLTSFHQSALPLALLLRMASVGEIAAVSEDYPGTLLDVRHHVPGDVHEVDRALSTVATLGYRLPPGDDGRLQIRHAAPDGRDGALARMLPPRPYVVVHPGASVPARAWAPERAAALVAELAAAGVRVVVTGGADERGLTARVAGAGSSASGAVLDAGGRLFLPELAAVLAGAAAVVVGNTGPAHLAAAVGTPVVSLFAPTVPAVRWRPWMVPHVLLGDQTAACAGTRAKVCPVPGHPCLDDVGAGVVIAALERLGVELPAPTEVG